MSGRALLLGRGGVALAVSTVLLLFLTALGQSADPAAQSALQHPIRPFGSCCLGENQCVYAADDVCEEMGGIFAGSGTFCDQPLSCDVCPAANPGLRAPPQITLTDCPANYIPQGRLPGTNTGDPGNSVTFTATIEGGLKRKIRFTMSGVSHEPGVCMNFGDEAADALDLKFIQTGTVNPADTFDAPAADGLTITTKDAVCTATVTVTCYDFGAFGRIKACFMNAAGDACEMDSTEKKVPRDDNSNNVADGAPQNTGPGGSSAATDDNEELPAGNGTKGDNLSRYEEYRGFMVNGAHVRGNVTQKDVFIRNNVGNVGGASLGDSGDFTTAILTTPVYAIQASEMNGSREINFKNSSHHIGSQTAVLATNGNGTASCTNSNTMGRSQWTIPAYPNNEDFCRVCIANIEANLNTIDKLVAANAFAADRTDFLPIEVDRGGREPGRVKIDNEIIQYTDQKLAYSFLRGQHANNVAVLQVGYIEDFFFRPAGVLRIDSELITYTGTEEHSTKLNGNHTAAVATMTVTSTADFANAGTISIENEVIEYTGKTPTTFTGCTRGARTTIANPHDNNVDVVYAVFTGCTRGAFGSTAAAHATVRGRIPYVYQRVFHGLTRGVAGTVAAAHSGSAGIKRFSDANDKGREVIAHEAGHICGLDHLDNTIMQAETTYGAWAGNGLYHVFINGGDNALDGKFRVKP